MRTQKSKSLGVLLAAVSIAAALLCIFCYKSVSLKDLSEYEVDQLIKRVHSDVTIVPSDAYLNKLTAAQLDGKSILKNGGVVLDKRFDLELKDIILHPEWMERISDFEKRSFPNNKIKGFWYRFDVENIDSKELKFFLNKQRSFFQFDKVYFYNSVESEWSGYDVSLSRRTALPLNTDNSPLFPMVLKPGEKGVVIINAESRLNKITMATLGETERTIEALFYYNIIAVLIGGIFGLVVFNFLLFLTTRDRVYLLYTSYKAVFILLILYLSIFPNWITYISDPLVHNETISWSIGSIANILALIFALKYLDVYQWGRTLYKISVGLILIDSALVATVSLLILAGFYTAQPVLVPYLVRLSFIFSFFILIIGFVGIYRGKREAYPYLLAWFVIVTTNMVTILYGLSIIDLDLPVDVLLAFGGFFEACLLSFGLGQKMNLQTMKIFTEKERRKVYEKDAKVVKEVLKISSEMHSFQKLDNIFSLVAETFDNLFSNLGFAIVLEPNRSDQITFSKYTRLSEESINLVKEKHFQILANKRDKKLLDQRGIASAMPSNQAKVAEILGEDDWTVIAGAVYAKSESKGITHRLKMFVKGSLSKENLNVVQILFDQILGLARMKFQADELEKIVNTDTLTGAFNRLYFDKVIGQISKKVEAGQATYAIVYCDINGLKKVNDKYGHKSGDALICGAVDLLNSVLRETDLIFRLGGDEIVIFCPETNNSSGLGLISRIEKIMNDNPIDLSEGVSHIVSLSFGLADSTEGTGDQLVDLADRRMLENKKDFYKDNEKYR